LLIFLKVLAVCHSGDLTIMNKAADVKKLPMICDSSSVPGGKTEAE